MAARPPGARPEDRGDYTLVKHHLRFEVRAGQHDPDTMPTLCGAHHRAVHAGTLSVSGTVSGGLEFLRQALRPT